MSRVFPLTITVLVPATSANLGPGFDSLGLALRLYNRFEISLRKGASWPGEYSEDQFHTPTIEIQGALGTGLSTGPDNLFFRAFASIFQRRHLEVPPVDMRMFIDIPPGCGLGSSATAVVGGLVAANQLLHLHEGGRDKSGYYPSFNGSLPPGFLLPEEDLLELAVEMEAGNHPDNVAPALLGGLVATSIVDGKIRAIKTRFPDTIKAIIFTPSFPMDTIAGRKLLPPSYSKADVTFNTGRVALLLTALQAGRYELIGEAMQDRLHQPYRQALFPAMPDIISAAIAAGAHGACLSGGGSSLIALASSNFSAILRAMQETAHSAGIEGTGMILRADQAGARVLHTEGRRKRKEVNTSHGDQFCGVPSRSNSS